MQYEFAIYVIFKQLMTIVTTKPGKPSGGSTRKVCMKYILEVSNGMFTSSVDK